MDFSCVGAVSLWCPLWYGKPLVTVTVQGFEEKDVESALRAVPVASATQEQVLDWLCLTLPARRLPTKYRNSRMSAGSSSGSGTTGKGVKVVHKGGGKGGKGTSSDNAGGGSARVKSEPRKSKKELQREEELRRQQQAQKAKQEKQTNKDWILSYMQDDSEEESEESDEEIVMWGEQLPTKTKKTPKVRHGRLSDNSLQTWLLRYHCLLWTA